MTNLILTLAGHNLPLMETAVKDRTDGRTYHTFRKPTATSGAFGVQVPALAPALPTSVTIDGVEVHLTKGKTAATFTDRTSKLTIIVAEADRRDKVSGKGTFTPAFANGEIRHYDVTVSVTKDGQWNVKAIVNRGGSSVSPEDRKAKAQTLAAANLASLAALLSS